MKNPHDISLLKYLSESFNSFAAWRLPGEVGFNVVASNKSVVVECVDDVTEVLTDGFIISPFDVGLHPIVFIPSDYTNSNIVISDVAMVNKKFQTPFDGSMVHTNQSDYLVQANYLISEIKKDSLAKVILSRIQLEKDSVVDQSAVFFRLCEQYPDAYVFWFCTPETGCWMGASPELFVETQNGIGKTVALAGTRKNCSEALNDQQWHQKEMDEQAIVTNYIDEVLSRYDIKNIIKQGPSTIHAGQMSHIKTTFEFVMPTNGFHLMSLVFDLHPTPAVCGIPKQAAKMLIAKTEKHDRAYYGGFVGAVNGADLQLYVNIRSMKIVNGDANLFVGGGLTSQSDSLSEWNETILKAQTILSVLKNNS